MLKLQHYTDPAAFLNDAGAFLSEHEAANCMTFGISNMLIARREMYGPDAPYLAAVKDDDDTVVLTAVRTPPRAAILSLSSRASETVANAAALIAEDLLERAPQMYGINGPVAVARAFAEAWMARTGQTHAIEFHERIYQLTEVTSPIGTPGKLRRVTAEDADLAAQYVLEFDLEAFENPITPEARDQRTRWVRDGLDNSYRALYFWEDDGPVCLVGVQGPTPHGMRIGPVYTPPGFRGRGYGSAATAAVSRIVLESGRTHVFLYTDLANSTSNKIYQAIGFRPVVDIDVIEFV